MCIGDSPGGISLNKHSFVGGFVSSKPLANPKNDFSIYKNCCGFFFVHNTNRDGMSSLSSSSLTCIIRHWAPVRALNFLEYMQNFPYKDIHPNLAKQCEID